MDPQNRMLVGENDGACWVQVSGRATALHCNALKQCVLGALEQNADRVCVDLRDCQYGDSTFLGTLLQFRKACARLGPDRFTLVSPTPQLVETLRTMGLYRLFHLDDAPRPEDIAWRALPPEEPGRCSYEFCENVVEAHRELAASSETRGDQYRQIAAAAEQELSQRR